MGGGWNRDGGGMTQQQQKQQQQQEEIFFNWWREEERRAWELFDVDAMYGLQDIYGRGCGIWGSEGLAGGQYRMMGLCC